MTGRRSTISPFIEKRSRGGPSHDSQNLRQPCTLIHILDDDSLLHIFSFCRQVILDENEAVDVTQLLEEGEWNRERWWYRVVKVCRRWRYLILQSASHLRLSLFCAAGTPVTDMLAHSPPLPLIIDHLDKKSDINAKDEEELIYALQQRDRVRRIRFMKPTPILEKLIINLDGEFPILEYLFIQHQRYPWPNTLQYPNLNLPETFRAPHLRHLMLMNSAIPIGSPLFTTMGNLVTLSLNLIPPSEYFYPNALLQRLSLIPKLEIFGITFNSNFPSSDIQRQLLHTPITMHVTLPTLRWLVFQGVSAYLEALLPRITTPHLERLQVSFFDQSTYSIPNLQQFVSAVGDLRFNAASLTFAVDHLLVRVYHDKEARVFTFEMLFGGRHLDGQVTCAAQFFHMLSTTFSAVGRLTLHSQRENISMEWNNEAVHTQWRELLGPFDKVNTLDMDDGLVDQLSRALQPSEGVSPTQLLPELQELRYYPSGRSRRDAFTSFVHARREAGHPIAVIFSPVRFGVIVSPYCSHDLPNR